MPVVFTAVIAMSMDRAVRDDAADKAGPGKRNCWEFRGCGREPGGSAVDELGPCPAATETSANGLNGGLNGGRICWSIAGTLCGGKVQGTAAAKMPTCLDCPFFKTVTVDEGARFLTVLTRVEVYAIDTRQMLEEQVFDSPPFLALGEEWPVAGSRRVLTGVEFLQDERSERLYVRLWVR